EREARGRDGTQCAASIKPQRVLGSADGQRLAGVRTAIRSAPCSELRVGGPAHPRSGAIAGRGGRRGRGAGRDVVAKITISDGVRVLRSVRVAGVAEHGDRNMLVRIVRHVRAVSGSGPTVLHLAHALVLPDEQAERVVVFATVRESAGRLL